MRPNRGEIILKRGTIGFLAFSMFVAALLAIALPHAAWADEQGETNRYNVVIVNDSSGSMEDTDPQYLRNKAAARFVAMLAEQGNKVGAVVFSNDIATKIDLADLDSVEARESFIQQLSSVPPKGWTNIGDGIMTAVDMLNAERNPDIPSVILLLTDGNTEMGSEDETKASLDAKANAIDAARNAGYKIYTVSLNANGEADSSELQQIASATGGEFREVKTADDLKDVYSLYYSLVFNSKSDNTKDLVIPQSGSISSNFEIASVGVEEVNILIEGSPSDFLFTQPDGTVLTKDQLAGTTYASEAFTAVKIANPENGSWGYTIKGDPDSHVRIDIVRNTDVKASIESDASEDGLSAGESAHISVKVLQSGTPISADQYSDFTGTATVADGSGQTKDYRLQLDGDALGASVPFSTRGSYTVTAHVTGEGYELATDTLTFNVGNSAPKANGTIEETYKIWPIDLPPYFSNTNTIDLTPGASDLEDSTLTYSIDSTSFKPEDYELDGSTLIMKGYSLSKGSFTVRATDSDGGSCTFDVKIDTINIGLMTVLIAGGVTLVVLVVLGIKLYLDFGKPFYGDVYVQPFDRENVMAGYPEKKLEGGRGRIRLSSFSVDLNGIDPASYFQASGKDYVELVCKKPVYAGGMMAKKVHIDGYGMQIPITLSEDSTKGIYVRFTSKLRNGF